MRRRWLIVAACAVTVLGFRGWSGRPAKAASIAHIAELAGGNLRSEVSSAQMRYIHSQPHHWRQCLIKN